VKEQSVQREFAGIIALAAMLSACVNTTKISRVETRDLHTVCIAEHKEVREGVLEAIQDALHGRGMTTRLVAGTYKEARGSIWAGSVNGIDTAGCETVLFYGAKWSWDMTIYMSVADIWMTKSDGVTKIGNARWKAASGSLRKWGNARERIMGLMNQLLDGKS
jgi:uncharacterized Fe-S cluster-containing radical SAM superfamily protein